MPDFLIPAAMALLALVTGWSVYKAWSPSQRESTRSNDVPLQSPSPSVTDVRAATPIDSPPEEATRTADRSRPSTTLAARDHTLPARWMQFAPGIAVGLVSLVAAGTALSQWLAAPVETAMRARTLLVVIAWGVAGLAAVVLVLSHRRARHPDAADVK